MQLLRQYMGNDWLNMVKWSAEGLVPAIAQDAQDGTVLMVAWMNREALSLTAREGKAVYWSRSRRKLWRKGEESGHEQVVKEIRLDCDNDGVMLQVQQLGGVACHTGRRSCFFQRLEDGRWVTVEPVLKDPDLIYANQPD
jgi:phosphoribosyl-AMP cyclohydrolase